MLLRIDGIYLQVHRALQPTRTIKFRIITMFVTLNALSPCQWTAAASSHIRDLEKQIIAGPNL